MSSGLSAEITAIATAVLALFAIITAVFAFLAFRKQLREVGMLIEQNDRDIRDRHRDQASRVVIRTGARAGRGAREQAVTGLILHIENTSQQPIYDGFTGYREGTQWIDGKERKPDQPAFLALMPGEQLDTRIGFADPVPAAQFWKDTRHPCITRLDGHSTDPHAGASQPADGQSPDAGPRQPESNSQT